MYVKKNYLPLRIVHSPNLPTYHISLSSLLSLMSSAYKNPSYHQSGSPPARLQRQLVGPAAPPQQLRLGRRRHREANAKQPKLLPRQRLVHLPRRYLLQRSERCRHRAYHRLGPGYGTSVDSNRWWEGLWVPGMLKGSAGWWCGWVDGGE